MRRRAIEPDVQTEDDAAGSVGPEGTRISRRFIMEPGRIIAGKWRLTRQLGQGGMGSVWGAIHETLGREVAVKFLHPQTHQLASMSERFVAEARMAASIKHRFVVDVFDFGVTEDSVPYMVLELLQGTSLAHRMDYGPPFGVRQAVQLLADCLRGLAAVHEAGIIHRDLKPDNIFVIEDADGVFPKLIDFGISKRTETAGALEADVRRSRLTQPGTVVGTPYYMSPEQLRGRQNLDQRSDVYSVGVMAYELLAGRLPFLQDNIGDLMVAIMVQGAPSLMKVRPELGPQLATVVARALAPSPEQRFPTALALREALIAVIPTIPDAAHSVVQTSPEPTLPGLIAHDAPVPVVAARESIRPRPIAVVPSAPQLAAPRAIGHKTSVQLAAAGNPFLDGPQASKSRRPGRTLLAVAAVVTALVALAATLWLLDRDPPDPSVAPFQVLPAPARPSAAVAHPPTETKLSPPPMAAREVTSSAHGLTPPPATQRAAPPAPPAQLTPTSPPPASQRTVTSAAPSPPTVTPPAPQPSASKPPPSAPPAPDTSHATKPAHAHSPSKHSATPSRTPSKPHDPSQRLYKKLDF